MDGVASAPFAASGSAASPRDGGSDESAALALPGVFTA